MAGKDISTIVILVPYFINVVLLYNRKKAWVKSKYKWMILSGLSTIAIISYFGEDKNRDVNDQLVHWAMLTPLIFSMLDALLMRWSFLIHRRDLYLWLRGSSEINDQKFSGGSHVRASDRVFSLILLFALLFLPFLILFFL